MDSRIEFVVLAQAGGIAMRELCHRFGIAPATGYKWLHRAESDEAEWYADRSRRPRSSPRRTAPAVEAAVLNVREEYPLWGPRKLAAVLRRRGQDPVPSASTITAILRRNGRLTPPERVLQVGKRFERAVPNQLWQMDFKGHVALAQGHGRLHPLTVLDDHSRYCLVLAACGDERGATVRERLTTAFRCYGLPDCMLADNGGPWGDSQHWTKLGVWLLGLGVGLSHGRPYHPQTQGKEERFHRTLKTEVLQRPPLDDLARAQRVFDRWRRIYNVDRPHEACGLQPPASRYRPSSRPYPEQLPAIEYGPEFHVHLVHPHGGLSLRGRKYFIGEAFAGERVGLLPVDGDGTWDVYYRAYHVATISERAQDDE